MDSSLSISKLVGHAAAFCGQGRAATLGVNSMTFTLHPVAAFTTWSRGVDRRMAILEMCTRPMDWPSLDERAERHDLRHLPSTMVPHWVALDELDPRIPPSSV